MDLTRSTCILATCLVVLVTARNHPDSISQRQDAPWQTTPNPTDPHEYVPSNYSTIRVAHAVLMSTVCLILFPFGALMGKPSVIKYHIIIQMTAFWMFVAAAGMGIWMAKEIDQLGHYHPVIGLCLLALLATQPATEILNLVFWERHKKIVLMAHIHLWLGRGLLAAGVIQGGLGFIFAASFPSAVVQIWPRVLYGVVAVIAYVLYSTIGVIRPVLLEEREKKQSVQGGILDGGDTYMTGGEINTMTPGVDYGYGQGYGRGYGYEYGYGGEMRRF